MSYSTLDRFGGIKTSYQHRQGNPSSALQAKTWWPDFGPGKDYSFLPRAHPADTIFDKVVSHGKWDATKTRTPQSPEKTPAQFRHPEPANEAMLQKAMPTKEVTFAAKAVTQKQAALRMAEMRQRRVDSWCGQAPIRMAASSSLGGKKELAMYGDLTDMGTGVPQLSRSEPSLRLESGSVKAASMSRELYEQHGYLVGRSRGQIADGKGGLQPRKHVPLSAHAQRFGNDPSGPSNRRTGPKKPSKQWRATPECSFVFDPTTFLPVSRGGSQLLDKTDKWPEPPAAGRRALTHPGSAFERSSSSVSQSSVMTTDLNGSSTRMGVVA